MPNPPRRPDKHPLPPDHPLHPAEGRALVRALIARMHAACHIPYKLGDIARQNYLHPSYLSTLFKEMTGRSFSDYLADVRLSQAKRLLEHTDMHISRITEMVGYNDRAYFSRMFARAYGVPPGRFRRAILHRQENREEYVYITSYRENRLVTAQDVAGLERFAGERGVRAVLEMPSSPDPAGQAGLLERVISNRPSGIMLCAAHRELIPGMQKAAAHGIGLVTVERDLPEGGRLCFIGTDWGQVGGALAARAVRETGGGKVGVVGRAGDASSQAALARIQGTPGVSGCIWQEGVEDLEAALAEARALIVLDAQMLSPVCAALSGPLQRTVPVFSAGASPEDEAWLEKGVVRALAMENRALFAYYGGIVLSDHVRGPFAQIYAQPASPEYIAAGVRMLGPKER